MSQIEDFELPELPEGWAQTTMGAVAQVVGGGTPDSKDTASFCESGGHAWLTPADLSGNATMYVSRGKRNLTDRGLRNSSAKLMPAGSVLMSSRAPIGYVAVAANEVSTNQGFKSFVCAEGLQAEFVAYWLRYIGPLLERMGSGTTFSEISGSRAKEIPLHFAPLAEQKRIVEKIDALLARVDAMRERLAKVPLMLKRFRQSVLAAACSGRLTDSEANDWKLTSFGDLLVESPQNGIYKPQSSYGRGTAIIRIDDFHDGSLKSISSLKRLHLSRPDVEKYRLRDRDILINRVNSIKFLGKSLVVRELTEPLVFESNMMRCSSDRERGNPEYLGLYLRSPQGADELRRNAKHAVNQSSINQTDVCSVPVLLPPLEEQCEIVRRVDHLFKLADAIEKRVAMATARAEKLTQSILSRAFRGELVPPSPNSPAAKVANTNRAPALLAKVSAGDPERVEPTTRRMEPLRRATGRSRG